MKTVVQTVIFLFVCLTPACGKVMMPDAGPADAGAQDASTPDSRQLLEGNGVCIIYPGKIEDHADGNDLAMIMNIFFTNDSDFPFYLTDWIISQTTIDPPERKLTIRNVGDETLQPGQAGGIGSSPTVLG